MDESTDVSNNAVLLFYVRYIDYEVNNVKFIVWNYIVTQLVLKPTKLLIPTSNIIPLYEKTVLVYVPMKQQIWPVNIQES